MRNLSLATVALSLLLGSPLAAAAWQAPPQTAPAFGGPGVSRSGDSGLTMPKVVSTVKPQYTAGAMRANVEGSVALECIVKADGTVGDVRIVRSLDAAHGLDEEAVKAAKRWRFDPGRKNGKAVPVVVSLELTFTLRNRTAAK